MSLRSYKLTFISLSPWTLGRGIQVINVALRFSSLSTLSTRQPVVYNASLKDVVAVTIMI